MTTWAHETAKAEMRGGGRHWHDVLEGDLHDLDRTTGLEERIFVQKNYRSRMWYDQT